MTTTTTQTRTTTKPQTTMTMKMGNSSADALDQSSVMVLSTPPRQDNLHHHLAVLKKANDEVLEWKLTAAQCLCESSYKWLGGVEVLCKMIEHCDDRKATDWVAAMLRKAATERDCARRERVAAEQVRALLSKERVRLSVEAKRVAADARHSNDEAVVVEENMDTCFMMTEITHDEAEALARDKFGLPAHRWAIGAEDTHDIGISRLADGAMAYSTHEMGEVLCWSVNYRTVHRTADGVNKMCVCVSGLRLRLGYCNG
jgi:hypothetical protein